MFGGLLIAAEYLSFMCEGHNPVAMSGRNNTFMSGRDKGRFYSM